MNIKSPTAVSLGTSTQLRLRSDLHLARKAWHCCMGLVIIGIYLGSGMSRSTAVFILSFFFGLDLLVETARLRIPSFNERVMKSWSAIMRKNEIDKMSGTPFYLGASILAIGVFPKPIAALSLLYLAFGDPIASLFGVLYGDRSVRFKNGKSLIGTAAGMIACALVTTVFLTAYGMAPLPLLVISVLGGLAGGAAELLPLDVDDNFSIPMVSGFVLWLLFILMG